MADNRKAAPRPSRNAGDTAPVASATAPESAMRAGAVQRGPGDAAGDGGDKRGGGGPPGFRADRVAARGWQEAGQIWAEFAQDAMRQSFEATQRLMSCRNLGDVMRAQNEILRVGLDSFLDKSARLSDISARLIADTARSMSTAQEAVGRRR